MCLGSAAEEGPLSPPVSTSRGEWVELRWSLLGSAECSRLHVLLYLLPRLRAVHTNLWSQFLSNHGAIEEIIYDIILRIF